MSWELHHVRTSTRPVYKRIPALSESMTPLTIDAVALLGLYVSRTPRPMAIPTGVLIAKSKAATMVTCRYRTDSFNCAKRAPRPRPSNVSVGNDVSPQDAEIPILTVEHYDNEEDLESRADRKCESNEKTERWSVMELLLK